MNNSTYNRESEITALLEQDKTKLGRYWSYKRRGLSAEQIAEREGDATVGWIFNYQKLIHILRDGLVPESPSLARQGASKVSQWLKSKKMSRELRDELRSQESILRSRAEDKQAQVKEVEDAVRASKKAVSDGTPGIYVYTLPHYLNYRIEQDTGKTLLKVGHSSKDVYYRTESQGRLTALPEEPILLRVYPANEARNAENEFKAWLKDADHAQPESRRAGSEWYITSTKFLDRVASSLGLEINIINEFDVEED